MIDTTQTIRQSETTVQNGLHRENGTAAIPKRASSLTDMRPTLVIGTGGTGQQIITFLKANLEERLGPTGWQHKIRLLAFDTAEEAFTVKTRHGEVGLEPGAELFNIGNVPVPSIMRHIEGLEAIRERLGPILPSLPPVVLRSGAKQLRPFGLLSLLWNYKLVSDELSRAIWSLAGREQAHTTSQEQGINIFICGSLVGGTGSGTFLDLAHLVRTFFNELGSQAEFCHITGIGVLPQAFYGISGPNLYPNTAAALQELNHLMVKGGFRARYPDGRVIASQEAPFNLFYVIDGVDERGQTWSGIATVCAMIAEGIYLQMGSQLGRKGENAFDNLDEALTGQTPAGDGTFYSSFGLGYLLFDAPAAADFCSGRFLLDLIQQGWLRSASDGTSLPNIGAGLAAEHLLPRLLNDPSTASEMRIELSLPNWLLHKRADEVTNEAARYVRGYGSVRVAETYLPQISRNGEALLAEQERLWTTWLGEHLLNPEAGIPTVLATLGFAQGNLQEWAEAARKKAAELAQRLERQNEAVAQLETAVSRAAGGLPFGRSNRIRAALTTYFQAAEDLYGTQIKGHLLNVQLFLWGELLNRLQRDRETAATLEQRLITLATRLEDELPQQAEQLAKDGVSHLSLADEVYVEALYQRHKPTWADVRNQVGDPLRLRNLTADVLENHFRQSLRSNFQPIERLSIEDVIRERAAEMTPRARRQQLLRRATPSWNINRARLPEGGAGLVRLEVLGVPDEMETEFADEAMLVSTRDPYRLMALVVVAGAPQSAFQQYDIFRHHLERERGRPFHILPDFLSNANHARLAFALGSIFGLVYNQGTFFYYRPVDSLAAPTLLANGLTNALQAFVARDGLAAEVSERVEGQIAQMGLREAINLLAEYYTTTPNGNTRLDEQTRELKRLVRDYTEDLRRIDEFNTGLRSDKVRG